VALAHLELTARPYERGLLRNTLTVCWWMASEFITYYSIDALFAMHLQKDLGLSPGMVAQTKGKVLVADLVVT
jgi:hypothetical protein